MRTAATALIPVCLMLGLAHHWLRWRAHFDSCGVVTSSSDRGPAGSPCPACPRGPADCATSAPHGYFVLLSMTNIAGAAFRRPPA